jgi:hypothetical protein
MDQSQLDRERSPAKERELKRQMALFMALSICIVIGCARPTRTLQVVGIVTHTSAESKPVLLSADDICIGGNPLIVPQTVKSLGQPLHISTKAVLKIITNVNDEPCPRTENVLLGPMEPGKSTAKLTVTSNSPTAYRLETGWIFVWDHNLYVETDCVIAQVEGSQLLVASWPDRDTFYLLEGTAAILEHRVTGDKRELMACEYAEADETGFLTEVLPLPDCPCPYDRGSELGAYLDDICNMMKAAF